MASVYRLPASLSTDGTKLPCSFSFQQGLTPSIATASASQLAAGASLTLTGTNLPRRPKVTTTIGAPTVSVCGGRECAVTDYDSTQIVCTMPDCDAITSDPILVHVAPHGYAAHDGSLVVAGVVSVTAVEGPGGVGAVARGSAAGGVRLTVTGTGFSAKQGDMSVALCEGVDGSGAATGCGVGTCDVIRSGGGSLGASPQRRRGWRKRRRSPSG